MKKIIAREILYLVSFVLIIGLFSVCIVSYNKMNINKLNKIPPELQNNFFFLQEKNFEFVCFNNEKFDYTIPIDMLGDFTVDRSDLKLVGKISIKEFNVDNLPDLTDWEQYAVKPEKEAPPTDELGIPVKLTKKEQAELDQLNGIKQDGAIEKLSAEETVQINAYIENIKSYKKYSNQILTEKDIYYNIKIVAIILLITFFLVRYLYYTVSWSLKTLKE